MIVSTVSPSCEKLPDRSPESRHLAGYFVGPTCTWRASVVLLYKLIAARAFLLALDDTVKLNTIANGRTGSYLIGFRCVHVAGAAQTP